MITDSRIVPAMPFADYQAVDALNYSSLKHMFRSPMAFRYHKDHPSPATPEQRLGHAIHKLILEPDLVGDFAVWGDRAGENVRRGKVWDEFQMEFEGREIITKAERDAMVGVSVAVRKSPLIRKYVDAADGANEVSLFWRDSVLDLSLKGRVDRLLPDFIIDLKSAVDVRPFKFGNAAYRLGYHMQSAMYQDGIYALTGALLPVVMIAVEKNPPYESAVFRLTNDVLQQGHEDYCKLAERMKECERDNHWPAALETETDLTLPSWAFGSDRGDDLSDLALVG